MRSEDFLDFIRRAFASLAERFGLREIGVSSNSYALKTIVFSNETRAVEFYLDVRDGYLDALYSNASAYTPDGKLAEPIIDSVYRQRSLRTLLNAEGVVWPTREDGLFEPGALEKAVRDLVAGIERHSQGIFGQAE